MTVTFPFLFRPVHRRPPLELADANGVIYTVGPLHSPDCSDLRAGYNLAAAHIGLARCLLELFPTRKPSDWPAIIQGSWGPRMPGHEAALAAWQSEQQKGAEVITALCHEYHTEGGVRCGPLHERNAHEAAYAAALYVARVRRQGEQPALTAAHLDELSKSLVVEERRARERRSTTSAAAAPFGLELVPGGFTYRGAPYTTSSAGHWPFYGPCWSQSTAVSD
jgi:hypothetical protein